MTSSDPVQPIAHAILLVDDNAHGMVARRRVLMDLGYQVHTARSGEEALNIIASGERRFDVVVTDYRMTCMTGVELIERIRGISPQTKTVLLSALVEPWGMTEESTGADAVIAKSSAEIGQLTRTVHAFLQKPARKKPVASQKRSGAQGVVKNG